MKLMLFATAGVLVALASVELACGKASAATTRTTGADAPPAAGAHVDGNHFKLDAAPAGDCKVGAECSIAIKLEAQGDYHINQQYPYKFKANDAAGVEFLGTDAAGKNVFSKGAGDFKIDGEKTATMNVRFKVAQKGTANIGGTYKISVCSAQNCQLEQQDMSVAVAAK
jgi:hypothetical protein